jgi:glycosyltransferase involved in cell wall biosynthesis
MKVCLITGEFPPMQGGVGDYTSEVSKALDALGVEVHVITSTRQDAKGRKQEGGSNWQAASCVLHPVVREWGWNCWRTIVKVVRQVQPDILHIQYQAAAYGMQPAINVLPLRMRLAGADRPRTVVTFHDLRVPYLFPKAGPLRWRAVLALARWTDAVIVTNGADQARLKLQGIQPCLIPIGSNIKPMLPAGYDRAAQRTRWGVEPDDFLMCHFGFMNERKGIETLLRALSVLVEETSLPGEPRLLMIGGKVGSSDPTNIAYVRRVEALIAKLGLEEQVLWTGFVSPEEVSASFAAADCCVLPYQEGASFQHGTLMAALAHGMAIVTTTSPNPGEQPPPAELMDGENVLLVPPGNAVSLAAAIIRLATSPELRRGLGEGARVLSRLFDWEGIASQHLEVYRGLA